MNDDAPAPRHRVPDGVDDATVAAVGKLSEALEWVERARGHLYEARMKEQRRTHGHPDHTARPGSAPDVS